VREKGFSFLLEAMVSLPEIELVLAGDGPLKDDLMARSVEFGVRERVQFPGPMSRSELHKLYSSALAACVPSLWGEPFGYAIAEAMAAGCPVLAFPVGAALELLARDRGYVAEGLTSQDLVLGIRRLLGDSAREERAQRARSFCWDELRRDRIAVRYEELYES
jgi:glycosyltransferase involved in cell wall biosynthesis